MGLLDRHLLRSFLVSWLVIGAVLLGFFTILDVIGHADELAQSAERYGPIGGEAVRYYAFNLLFLLVQFAPYLTLLAALATVIQVGKGGEWTPVLTAGRSTLRAVRPLFVGAALVAVGMTVLREAALPRLVIPREALSRRLFNQRTWSLFDAWARSRDDHRLRADKFLPRGDESSGGAAVIEGMEVFYRGPEGEERVLRASRAVWDGRGWVLEDGQILAAEGEERLLDRYDHPGLGPRDLILAYLGQTEPLDLSTAGLQELLARDPAHRQAATLVWAWRAAPLGHWVLLLLGLPFTLRLDRRSALEGLARGLLLCLLFFVGEFVLRDLGGRGVVGPFLGGCGPTLLFGSLGIWAVDKLPT